GEDVQRFGLGRHCVLQRLQQREVLGNIIVLVADPLGDTYRLAAKIVNEDADSRRARIPVRSTVDIGGQGVHSSPLKSFISSHSSRHEFGSLQRRHLGFSLLCKRCESLSKISDARSRTSVASIACYHPFLTSKNAGCAHTLGVDIC